MPLPDENSAWCDQLDVAFRETVAFGQECMKLHLRILEEHGQRVALIADHLAVAEGSLDIRFRIRLRTAALLHDIGFIGVPADLIVMRLTDMKPFQRKRWQKHSEFGYRILEVLPNLKEIAGIVRHHHEAFDGSGFPDHLRGDRIPLESRMIHIADIVDKSIYPFSGGYVGSCRDVENALSKTIIGMLDPVLTALFLERVLHELFTVRIQPVPIEKLKPGMTLAYDLTLDGGSGSMVLLRGGTRLNWTSIKSLLENPALTPEIDTAHISVETIRDEEVDPLSFLTRNPQKMEKVDISEKWFGSTSDTVVVVDDDEHVLKAMNRELIIEGFSPVCYTNQKKALEFIKKEQVLALISDFNMPGMKGDKFIELARSYVPDLPCIVVTGFATRENVMQLMKGGHMTRLLVKPWEAKELSRTLEEIRTHAKR